jgi:imidazolonepropionase-like amidohydrolase
MSPRELIAPVLVVLAAGLGATSAATAGGVSNSFAVHRVRVFDGLSVIESATVVVIDGRIEAVGRHVQVPVGIPAVDGRGRTLLPGFIDAHGHSWDRLQLERSAHFGVTTLLDMWTDPAYAAAMRLEQAEGGASDRADMLSAGNPAATPEGYPYVFTPDVIEEPTLSTAAEAWEFVEGRLAEGSDYMKLMHEDDGWTGLDLEILPRPEVRALITELHRRGRIAVAHVTESRYARDLVLDGIDGLVHILIDEPARPAFVQLARERGIFVVPTLAAEEGFIGTQGGEALLADPEIAPWLFPWEAEWLLTPGPPSSITPEHLGFGRESVRRLAAAGVPILAGTDVATPGLSFHRDLELLVAAGLTPRRALIGATSAAAVAFGLADRGRILPGLRADLVLVDGDPTEEILATRAIRRIWKGGVEVERSVPGAVRIAAPLPAGDRLTCHAH